MITWRLTVAIVTIGVFLLLALPTQLVAQCTKDTDCKGDRICVNGSCVEPSVRSGSAGATQQGTSLPDQAAMRSHLDERVASESQGALTLETFEKTNGYEEELTHFYITEWQADIRFNRQGWKPGDAIGGYWNDFQVMPAQGGFLSGSWIHFDQDARVRLKGICTGRRTEKGWRLQELEVRSYQKLAASGPTEQTPSMLAHTQASAEHLNFEKLSAAIDRGEEVAFKIRYDNAVYPYHYLHDRVLTVSKTSVKLGGDFTVAPDKILELTNQPQEASRILLKVTVQNARRFFGKDIAGEKDFYLYNPSAVTVGVGPGGTSRSIACNGCDDSMSILFELLQKVSGKN